MNAPKMWRKAKADTSSSSSSTASTSSTATDHSATNGDDTSGAGRSSGGRSSGSADALPPGWKKKESSSQPGKFYYISPAGKTQWTPPAPPPAKKERAQVQYNWVHEIEIEFGEGRLGVSLREVRQLDSIPYPQYQAEVDDLPKINGKAGPAELYNWSVKPHQRLTIGMRITFIEGTSLAGFTYKEIVDKLKRAHRPVKLRFADVDQGTVEENPHAAKKSEQPDTSSTKKSQYLEQKQQYTRVLVTSELHTEMWSIETKKLDRQMALLKKKWTTVSSEFDALNGRRVELQKEHDKLVDEKQKYSQMIKQLKMQENHEVGNPELIKANELAKKHAELTEDIAKMGSGNKRLRKERVTQQATLDELESQLAQLGKLEDDDKNDDDLFFGIDPNAPPAEQLAAIRKKMRFMDDELIKEQRKAARAEKETEQLNRHLAKLNGKSSSSSSQSSSSSSAAAKPESRDSSTPPKPTTTSSSTEPTAVRSSGRSSELPKDAAGLEARIAELRKMQRSIVDSLSKAARDGDKDLARECQKKRKVVKDELGRAQDALNALNAAKNNEGQPDEQVFAPSRGASGRTEQSSGTRQLQRTMSTQEVLPSSSSSSSNKKKPPQHPPAQEAKMPTLSGFLDKGPTEWSEGGLIRGMKTMRGARERWCEITEGGYLRYYKRRGDPVVRGEIDLSDSSFEVTCEDMRGKEFVLCTSDQQSHFFTKSTEELQRWVKTLRAANAYLKTNRHLDSLAGKLDAADRRHGGGMRGMPEEDEEFYGRATLGF